MIARTKDCRRVGAFFVRSKDSAAWCVTRGQFFLIVLLVWFYIVNLDKRFLFDLVNVCELMFLAILCYFVAFTVCSLNLGMVHCVLERRHQIPVHILVPNIAVLTAIGIGAMCWLKGQIGGTSLAIVPALVFIFRCRLYFLLRICILDKLGILCKLSWFSASGQLHTVCRCRRRVVFSSVGHRRGPCLSLLIGRVVNLLLHFL